MSQTRENLKRRMQTLFFKFAETAVMYLLLSFSIYDLWRCSCAYACAPELKIFLSVVHRGMMRASLSVTPMPRQQFKQENGLYNSIQRDPNGALVKTQMP